MLTLDEIRFKVEQYNKTQRYQMKEERKAKLIDDLNLAQSVVVGVTNEHLFNNAYTTVIRWCKFIGLDRKSRSEIPADILHEVKLRLANGQILSEIAKELGIKYRPIYYAVTNNGALSPVSKLHKAAELLKQGKTVKEVMDETGYSLSTLKKAVILNAKGEIQKITKSKQDNLKTPRITKKFLLDTYNNLFITNAVKSNPYRMAGY